MVSVIPPTQKDQLEDDFLNLNWLKKCQENQRDNTDTINASSTVPASIPTIPTVQLKGRTLKTIVTINMLKSSQNVLAYET